MSKNLTHDEVLEAWGLAVRQLDVAVCALHDIRNMSPGMAQESDRAQDALKEISALAREARQ